MSLCLPAKWTANATSRKDLPNPGACDENREQAPDCPYLESIPILACECDYGRASSRLQLGDNKLVSSGINERFMWLTKTYVDVVVVVLVGGIIRRNDCCGCVLFL